MDMNRKNRFGLKNKKTQMAVSLIQRFVLILAVFVMMATIAHAGAFLTGDRTPSEFTDFLLIDGSIVKVVDRSRSEDPNDETAPVDVWNDSIDGNNSIGGYTGPDYYGPTIDDPVFYLGTFDGNEQPDHILSLIKHFLNDLTIENLAYAKVDMPDGDDENYGDTEFENDGLKITVTDTKDEDPGEAISGTWEFIKNDSNETIDFYTIKGGDEYALYYVNPAQSSGTWTTAHVIAGGNNQAALSHFSVMKAFENDDPNVTDPIPEPATMLLFGFSLIGLAGMARRKNSKF